MMYQVKVFTVHPGQKVFNGVTESIAGGIKIGFRIGNNWKVLCQLYKPGNGLENSNVWQQPVNKIKFCPDEVGSDRRQNNVRDHQCHNLNRIGTPKEAVSQQIFQA